MKETITTDDIPWKDIDDSIDETLNQITDEKLEDIKKMLPGKVVYKPAPLPAAQLSPEQRKFNQAMQMAITLSRSQIVPMHFRSKPDDVFAAIQLGSELGFKPMQSLNCIVMIQGNATLKAQTMLALIRSRCPQAIIKITQEVESATCFMARDKDDLGYEAVWSKEKAVRAKFAVAWDKELKKIKTKDNWENQPGNMSKWRAVMECARVIFPEVIMGLYSAEEIEDMNSGVDREEYKNEKEQKLKDINADFQEKKND